MKHRSTRTSVALAAVAGVTLAMLAQPASAAPGTAAAHPAAPAAAQAGDKSPLGLAVAAADRAVASGVDALVKGPQTTFDRQMVTPWVNGLYSVAYEQTYRGLPVVGGDAVVLADGKGAVRASQAASRTAITVPVSATVTAAAAEKTARARLRAVTKVSAPRLVVRISADKAHLAWETVVTGRTKTAPSNLHVFVDARKGGVIDTTDDVVAGTGNSQWNGPNPLTIDTSGSSGSYSMQDPTRPNLSCGDYSTNSVMTGADDDWGTGYSTSEETGCVDAMYASQKQWDMLKSWLGRNGLNGNGSGWPIYVGLNQVNAYWNGSSVSIGHNTANEWIASVDVVAHENGHGIDTNTPGGAGTEAGLGEGTGDIFGALTEAYANEPSPYDTPGDYVVGETINLSGNGPIRNMWNPSAVGDPSCYSSSIPNTEVHSAAGPLNHWFYLLAEGTAPTAKVPSGSTACNNATLQGVGIQNAGKIFYGAMLLKTSSMTYAKYRVATLAAAKALDPTCVLHARTKAAWDAISLPAQSGEVSCTPSGVGDFSLALSPASGSLRPGESSTATVSTTATGQTQPVALSATGAAPGVSVTFSPATVIAGQSSTMTVTASSSATAGSSTITVTGKGTTLSHTADYSLAVVNGTPNPTPGVPDIGVAAVQAHLAQLGTIATSNGGNRRAGSGGHTASVAYLKAKLQAAGYTVSEQVCTTCTYRSNNLVADWPGGPANAVTMLGAHLDSVGAGPGINDNGSGSAVLLENALALAKANPAMTRHVRFAWWTDEEQGMKGSDFYVRSLSSTEKSAITAYYNFDMIASTNGGYFINNLTSAAAAPMKAYWDSLNLQPEENVEGQGRSDDASFQTAGIPTSGYAMGASARKTSAQAAKWGGTANAAYDPCYHSACDTTANINATGLNRSADGVAHTIWKTSVGAAPTPTDDFSLAVSPTAGTVDAGAAATARVGTAVTSGTAQTVALSASGAPSGVSVAFSPASVTAGGSSTMTVRTSSSVTPGTYTITVTGTAGGTVHTSTYSLTVNGAPTGDCAAAIQNGGFESGTAPWTASPGVIDSSAAQPAHSGSFKTWMDGYGSSHTDSVSQTVTIPAGCTTLSFFLHIDTAETGTAAYDELTVTAGGRTLGTYSNADASVGYVEKTLDLTGLPSTVTLTFTGVEDSYLQTSFVVDDVTLRRS